MRIAIDYDGTFTRDVGFWDEVACLARDYGHEVVIVTARPVCTPVELPAGARYPVWYTNGAKKRLVYQADVWIDDRPEDI